MDLIGCIVNGQMKFKTISLGLKWTKLNFKDQIENKTKLGNVLLG